MGILPLLIFYVQSARTMWGAMASRRGRRKLARAARGRSRQGVPVAPQRAWR